MVLFMVALTLILLVDSVLGMIFRNTKLPAKAAA